MKKTNKITPAIEIKNIHKEFILPQSKNTSMKQVAVNIVKRNNKVTQKVLDGVSFTINKGDFFGIVGRNGSGKSTLLKLIAGVYYPTAGEIALHGGLTPFIELGVGFNPELSGRDNVYLNGALLGFSREQMDEMYDEIVEFAELAPFMDQKLKNYSSGMQVRLAFSIAIKAKNDILIFDEVLAVGDEAFQRKCLDVFESYKASGQTVVLVTHDMDTVKKFCNRAALIQSGKLIKQGNPVEVADTYSELNLEKVAQEVECKQSKKEKTEICVRIDRSVYNIADDMSLTVEWPSSWEVDSVMVDLYRKSGELVTNFISSRESKQQLEGNSIKLSTKLLVTSGSYFVNVTLWNNDMLVKAEYELCTFVVSDKWPKGMTKNGGLCVLPRSWQHTDK